MSAFLSEVDFLFASLLSKSLEKGELSIGLLKGGCIISPQKLLRKQRYQFKLVHINQPMIGQFEGWNDGQRQEAEGHKGIV